MNNLVARPLLSSEEISRWGEELYANRLRAQVETNENIGKIIAFDINTGEYEIDAFSLSAADRLRARFPDAVVYALRIGYDAVYTLRGIRVTNGEGDYSTQRHEWLNGLDIETLASQIQLKRPTIEEEPE